MTAIPRVAASVFVIVVATTAVFSQCPAPNGLALQASGMRLGDPFSIGLLGTPGVAGSIGFDTTPGPVSTPIGVVCLGLTPALQLIPFTLDSQGFGSLGGVSPVDPSLIGFTAYLQAGAVDSSQPSGFALSNGANLTMRSPRMYFIDPGSCSSTPGKWCAYDALIDWVTTPAIQLPACVIDAILVPSLGWIAFLLGNSTIVCYDTTTGAQTLSFPVITTPGFPSKLGVDGTTLYLLHYGTPPNPFAPTLAGGIRAVSLPSGTYGLFVQLPSGNPDDFLVIGGGLVYVRTGNSVRPLDVINGAALAPIVLGGSSGAINAWIRQGNRLYCLMPGSAGFPPFGVPPTPPSLAAIDTTTHTTVFPAPVTIPVSGPSPMMRLGPGAAGNTLFVYAPSASQLVEVNPATLQPYGSVGVSNMVAEMTLSAGGTEWLLSCSGSGCPLTTLTPPTMTSTAIAPVPHPADSLQVLVALPSSTFRKAYTVFKDHNTTAFTVVPITTDPTLVPSFVVGLPIASSSIRCLVD